MSKQGWEFSLSYELAEIGEAARKFWKFYSGKAKVFLFDAPMGGGKTTFIRALCRDVLGVEVFSGSPTFGLVNEYVSQSGETVYHFDFYRVKSQLELVEIDFGGYLDSGAWCFVEWPEKALPFLDAPYVEVVIETENFNARRTIFGRLAKAK